MARKIKLESGSEESDTPEGETPIVAEPEETPIVNEPEPAPVVESEPVSAAIPIVNLDDEIAKESAPVEQQQNGVSFWFGHVGVIKFKDKSEYHIRANRAFITDPKLIENLTEASKNPTSKIFPQ